MRIILAPMHGVVDHIVRQLLCSINSYDLCVSEFIRVVDCLLPNKVFYKSAPELKNNGYTANNTPLRIQLLGQEPTWLAENAHRAIKLGSHGIDLNCGCPSKTVNGHQAGATLLKNPELIYQATKALRSAVDHKHSVSVKVRLGWDSTQHSLEIADAVQQGGANEITIHARTKVDGFKPERLNWAILSQLKQFIHIPIIANGDIFSLQTAQDCQRITQCDGLMIGRGAMNIPNLAQIIRHNHAKLAWQDVLQLLYTYLNTELDENARYYHASRIKQWLRFLSHEYPQAIILFNHLKLENKHAYFIQQIENEISNYN